MAATNSSQVQFALDFLSAFGDNDFIKASTYLGDDLQHEFLPSSLDGQKRSKAEFFELADTITPLLNGIKIHPQEIIEVPGKVVMHVKSSSISKTNVPYANELILIFHISCNAEDGSMKIVHLKEFIDSKYTESFFTAERERAQSKT